MERRGRDNEIAERILGSRRPGMVLRGPAGCGKTSAVLTAYERLQDEAGRGGCVLLAPNRPAAEALRRRLLERSEGGVTVGAAVWTFAALEGRILAGADERARPMGALRRRLLLREIVSELHRAGRLAALGAVVQTPGLIDVLDRAIAELKRAAVEPEDLATAVGGGADKRADLAAVYGHYQRRLRECGAYDVEGRAWLAREHLARAAAAGKAAPGLGGVSAVLADGFTDFTPTQMEILRLLSGQVGRVVVTLPWADDGRERMWHWTGRTLARLRKCFGDLLEEVALEPSAGRGGALRETAEGLFRLDGLGSAGPGVSVICAAGLEAEVRAVGRRIKAMLRDGAAGRIGVLARSPDAYGPVVRRIFREYGIPVADAPLPLVEVPVVRFLLDAAALVPGFVWRDVLRVIRSSYFRPGALGAYDAGTVAAAEWVIRTGNVVEGRGAYAAAVERLAALAEAGAEPAGCEDASDEEEQQAVRRPSAEAIRQAGAMVEALLKQAEAATDAAGLAGLLDALGAAEAARSHGSAELVARDLRALAALRAALAELPASADIATVREALSVVMCPAARGESLVDVLDVLDARPLRYEHVFLLGVSERVFPARHREGSLLGEAEREALRARGFAVDSRRDLTAREMLLFYLAVSRADGTLTLSCQEADASGARGAPSAFLLGLLGEAGLDDPRVRRVTVGEVLPPQAQLSGPAEAMKAAVAGLFGTVEGDYGAALGWAARARPDALGRAAMGIWAGYRRWRPGECNEYDGRITDPALLEGLSRRYPGETVFSAGQLEAYGRCPWSFFGRYVLKLEPLVEPQRRLEPRARGLFCHAVLFRLMRGLTERSGGPVRLADVEEDALRAALEEAVAAEARQVEAAGVPYPALWQIQRERMRQELWDYLQLSRRLDPPGEALHFELAFGSGRLSAGGVEPAGRCEPVEVATPAGAIRLRGRIDRVDRLRTDVAGGLLVVDYKTGRLPSDGDFAAGRSLQVPLYVRAVEALLGGDAIGGVFHRIGGRRSPPRKYLAAVTVSRTTGAVRADESYEARLAAGLEAVGRFVKAMAGGRFDVLPTEKCPSWCPLRRICHFSPVRADVKGPAAGGEEAR